MIIYIVSKCFQQYISSKSQSHRPGKRSIRCPPWTWDSMWPRPSWGSWSLSTGSRDPWKPCGKRWGALDPISAISGISGRISGRDKKDVFFYV